MSEERQGRSVLVVDDSDDMRILLEQILDEEGYTLFFAEDGDTAIAQATEHHPGLILMDMSLPGMSGWEAVEQLRQMSDFKHTPIIAVTAHVLQADKERAFAIGCSAYLGKPFDLVEVLDMIDAQFTDAREYL
jgi:two-component system cell cycle response regulator DivK